MKQNASTFSEKSEYCFPRQFDLPFPALAKRVEHSLNRIKLFLQHIDLGLFFRRRHDFAMLPIGEFLDGHAEHGGELDLRKPKFLARCKGKAIARTLL